MDINNYNNILLIVSAVLLSNHFLNIVKLPKLFIKIIKDLKNLLAITTVILSYYHLPSAVLSASLLYLSMMEKSPVIDTLIDLGSLLGGNKEEDIDRPLNNQELSNELNQPEEKCPFTPPDLIKLSGLSKDTQPTGFDSNPHVVDGQFVGILADDSREPAPTPLKTQYSATPSDKHDVPLFVDGTHDVDESQFIFTKLNGYTKSDLASVNNE